MDVFPRSTPWPAFLEIEKGLISKHFKASQNKKKLILRAGSQRGPLGVPAFAVSRLPRRNLVKAGPRLAAPESDF
jgi:hypothetical protein